MLRWIPPQAALVFGVCLLVAAASARAADRSAALSEAELTHLVANEVPASDVVQIVKLYGVGFELQPDVDMRLRDAGASDELMSALRQILGSSPGHSNTSSPTSEAVTASSEAATGSAANGLDSQAGQSNIARRGPFAVKDAFHIVGISALKRNDKFDLTVSGSEMVFSKSGKRVYSIPFERLNRVQVNPTQRHYAKSTYAAVLAFGAPGALMLAKKRTVDALIVDYTNERGGLMQMVVQVPKGTGTPCLGRLAYGGVPIGPPEDGLPVKPRS